MGKSSRGKKERGGKAAAASASSNPAASARPRELTLEELERLYAGSPLPPGVQAAPDALASFLSKPVVTKPISRPLLSFHPIKSGETHLPTDTQVVILGGPGMGEKPASDRPAIYMPRTRVSIEGESTAVLAEPAKAVHLYERPIRIAPTTKVVPYQSVAHIERGVLQTPVRTRLPNGEQASIPAGSRASWDGAHIVFPEGAKAVTPGERVVPFGKGAKVKPFELVAVDRKLAIPQGTEADVNGKRVLLGATEAKWDGEVHLPQTTDAVLTGSKEMTIPKGTRVKLADGRFVELGELDFYQYDGTKANVRGVRGVRSSDGYTHLSHAAKAQNGKVVIPEDTAISPHGGNNRYTSFGGVKLVYGVTEEPPESRQYPEVSHEEAYRLRGWATDKYRELEKLRQANGAEFYIKTLALDNVLSGTIREGREIMGPAEVYGIRRILTSDKFIDKDGNVFDGAQMPGYAYLSRLSSAEGNLRNEMEERIRSIRKSGASAESELPSGISEAAAKKARKKLYSLVREKIGDMEGKYQSESLTPEECLHAAAWDRLYSRVYGSHAMTPEEWRTVHKVAQMDRGRTFEELHKEVLTEVKSVRPQFAEHLKGFVRSRPKAPKRV